MPVQKSLETLNTPRMCECVCVCTIFVCKSLMKPNTLVTTQLPGHSQNQINLNHRHSNLLVLPSYTSCLSTLPLSLYYFHSPKLYLFPQLLKCTKKYLVRWSSFVTKERNIAIKPVWFIHFFTYFIILSDSPKSTISPYIYIYIYILKR